MTFAPELAHLLVFDPPPERLFTAADLARFPTELPSGIIDYELWEGVLIFSADSLDPLTGQRHQFRIEDLPYFPNDLPSGPIDYELDHGRLVYMAPPGGTHGNTQGRVFARLFMQSELIGHGKAFTEVSVVVSRNPDTVLVPDVAFIAAKSLPERKTKEDYLLTIPELAVEVRSKNNSRREIQEKVTQYLAIGVEVVWVVDPKAKTVTIHTPGAQPVQMGSNDTLTLPSLIPNLSISIADLFYP